MSPSSPLRALALSAVLASTAALAGCHGVPSALSHAASKAARSAAARAASSGSGSGSYSSSSDHVSSNGLLKIHDPKKVTYSVHFTTCHFGDGGQLPDPKCTPGAIDPSVTQSNLKSTICKKGGYTKKVRPSSYETGKAKYETAYPAYGVSHSKKSELDHLVSLELGGSNDIANLWPEVGKQPNPKDKVENDLHAAVCDGDVSLAAAQEAIATNWETADAKLGITGKDEKGDRAGNGG